MLAFPVSPVSRKRKRPERNGQTHRPTTKGPTHRPPLHHTTCSQEEREKRTCFPNLPRSCDRRKLVPCPLPPSDHHLPCLPATFRLASRPSKRSSPATGCSALGKIMAADDGIGWLVEKSVFVTWLSVLAGMGLSNATSPKSHACRAMVRLYVGSLVCDISTGLRRLVPTACHSCWLKTGSNNLRSIVGPSVRPGNRWGSPTIFPVSSISPGTNTRESFH